MLEDTNIDLDDIVHDLSHNASKNFILSPVQHKLVLKIFKKNNMSSGYIRNVTLRKKYNKIGSVTKISKGQLRSYKKKIGFYKKREKDKFGFSSESETEV